MCAKFYLPTLYIYPPLPVYLAFLVPFRYEWHFDGISLFSVTRLRLPQTCYGVLHVMNTHTHHPIPRQCDSGFVCCQTVCLTVARPPVLESAVRKRPMTEPPFFVCFQTDCLSVARRFVSVARLGDEGANPLFVCWYLSN